MRHNATDGGATVPPPPTDEAGRPPAPDDIVDVWGEDSFPASDPPANW